MFAFDIHSLEQDFLVLCIAKESLNLSWNFLAEIQNYKEYLFNTVFSNKESVQFIEKYVIKMFGYECVYVCLYVHFLSFSHYERIYDRECT